MQIVIIYVIKCPLLIQNVENVLTAEGTGLVTALRVLYHIACPPPAVEGKDTKHDFCNNRADKVITLSLFYLFIFN